MTTQKLDARKLSDDDLQDMFSAAYEKRVASQNGFDSYECICKRDSNNAPIRMEVTVTGMAGSPTVDEYKKMKVKNSDAVVIEREGKGRMKFKLVPSETIALNTNDYMVVYKSE